MKGRVFMKYEKEHHMKWLMKKTVIHFSMKQACYKQYAKLQSSNFLSYLITQILCQVNSYFLAILFLTTLHPTALNLFQNVHPFFIHHNLIYACFFLVLEKNLKEVADEIKFLDSRKQATEQLSAMDKVS